MWHLNHSRRLKNPPWNQLFCETESTLSMVKFLSLQESDNVLSTKSCFLIGNGKCKQLSDWSKLKLSTADRVFPISALCKFYCEFCIVHNSDLNSGTKLRILVKSSDESCKWVPHFSVNGGDKFKFKHSKTVLRMWKLLHNDKLNTLASAQLFVNDSFLSKQKVFIPSFIENQSELLWKFETIVRGLSKLHQAQRK